MTGSALGVWGANQALAALALNKTLYLGAHTSNPSRLGLLSSEVAGGGYIRQAIKFSTPAGGGIVNTTPFAIPGMPACVVTWFAVWTSITNGNIVFLIDCTASPIHVAESQTLRGIAGDLGFSL